MDHALSSAGDESILARVRQEVRALTGRYPLPG
jgi:hypothetical protein